MIRKSTYVVVLGGLLALAAAKAHAQGIDVNSGGRLTINAAGFVDINAGDLNDASFVELTTATSTLEIAGGVAVTAAGAINVTGGMAATINVAGNWSDSGSFSPGLSVVTLNGAADETIVTNETFYALTVNKGGGSLKITDGTTTTVSGPFTITGTTPTITGTAAAGYLLNLNGNISVSAANINYVNPLTIGGSGTVTFDNVAFGNFLGGYLKFTRPDINVGLHGCSFAAGPTGTSTSYNVRALTSDGATNTRVTLEDQSDAINGVGRGEDKDWDDDPDADGLVSGTGAVVTWTYAVGTPTGSPLGALDMGTFAWYGTFVGVKNANGRGYVLKLGSTGQTLGFYSYAEATYGTMMGQPWWDSDPGTGANKRVYFVTNTATNKAYLFRLNDANTGANHLSLAWSLDLTTLSPQCQEATSSLIGATIAGTYRLYFGGREDGVPNYRMYAITGGASAPSSWSWTTAPSGNAAIRGVPGFYWTYAGVSPSFLATSDVGGGAAHIYKFDADAGTQSANNTTSKSANMRAPLTISGFSMSTQHALVGDYDGKLQMVDADAASLPDYPGFPYDNSTHTNHNGATDQNRAGVFFDSGSEMAYYGDSDGGLYIVEEGVAAPVDHDPDGVGGVSAYPLYMGETSAITTMPLYDGDTGAGGTGKVYLGNANGKVWKVTRTTKGIETSDYGAGMSVEGMAWATIGASPKYMFTLSNGKTYYIDP